MLITEEEMNRRLSSGKNLANKISDGAVVSSGSVSSDAVASRTPKPSIFPLKDNSPSKAKTIKPFDDKSAPSALATMATVAASLVSQGCDKKDVVKELGLTFKDLRPDNVNATALNASLDRVRELALSKLMFTLGCMTPDMLEGASLKELSTVTGNLARVLDKTASVEINDNRVQFVVMQPPVRNLSSFEVLDV